MKLSSIKNLSKYNVTKLKQPLMTDLVYQLSFHKMESNLSSKIHKYLEIVEYNHEKSISIY